MAHAGRFSVSGIVADVGMGLPHSGQAPLVLPVRLYPHLRQCPARWVRNILSTHLGPNIRGRMAVITTSHASDIRKVLTLATGRDGFIAPAAGGMIRCPFAWSKAMPWLLKSRVSENMAAWRFK